ncbi:MAG: S8 family peptidase [Taibaiella sp.]|nr:S8 family peptidase [Taibaiella sp.]
MLRYIFMFVLVITMVKTNAQTYINYRVNDESFSSRESDDVMMIFLTDVEDLTAHDNLRAKIANDNDFEMYEMGGEVYVIRRKSGSSLSKSTALSSYINESYVRYAAFAIDGGGDNYCAFTNEILVKAKQGVTLTDIVDVVGQHGYLEIEPLAYSEDVFHVVFPKSVSTNDIIDDLYATDIFDFVEHNLFFHVQHGATCNTTSLAHNCVPLGNLRNDPSINAQWALENDGTSIYAGTAGSDINICHAWDVYAPYNNHYTPDGDNVIVAVIDDGVDASHPDLAGNMLRDVNGNVIGFDISGNFGPAPQQCPDAGCPNTYSSHGTNCAGIIAAEQNNSVGISGVAYNSKIMPIRAWVVANSGIIYTTSWMTVAFNTAVANDADVINFSFAYYPGTPLDFFPSVSLAFDNAVNNAATNGKNGKGCVIVAGSGNDNLSNISYPASNTNVIAVGGMSMCSERKSPTSCDIQPWGANYGTGLAVPGLNINTSGVLSVVAPAVDVLTTSFFSPGGMHSYHAMDGTSASAPLVAGTAALMLGANPCLTASEVKTMIEMTAHKITGYSYSTYYPHGYWNSEVGFGRLNAGDAVKRVLNIYKQTEAESGVQTYMSPNNIFAGRNWPQSMSCKIPGGYWVNPGVDITFLADKTIFLSEGFHAYAGSKFLASIDNNCDPADHHYKPGKKDKNEINPSGKQPILSSSDNLLHGIKVYPNPAKETINIEFMLEGDADVSFTMLNMLGQKMKETETTGLAKGMQKQQISLQGLTPGVYFVGIKTPAGYSQFRFIKE